IGMQSIEEVHANILKFDNKEIPDSIKEKLNKQTRELQIQDWCLGCGMCVKNCSHKALTIVDNKVVVDKENCVLCGYCSKYCKDFCIKVI
ncbi:MAG TPA: aldo/keto reductase, partial [Peptostreptococcaceae bacterium]|nr:aldo/keto reductase [Peptostreptococcaceae bacterium]